MRRIWLVTVREYVATVRRKGFLIATLGMPLFILGVFAFSAVVGFLTLRTSQDGPNGIAVVDESGLIDFDLLAGIQKVYDQRTVHSLDELGWVLGKESPSELMQMAAGRLEFTVVSSREEAEKQAHLRGFYVIPADYLKTGEIDLVLRKGRLLSNERPGWRIVQSLIGASLVTGKLSEEAVARVSVPPRLKTVSIHANGRRSSGGLTELLGVFAVPYVFTVFFMLSIMTSAGYLLQSVAEEKENRVMEILLSSLTPDQLLAGKVLGLCAAGLTQILIWASMGVLPALVFLPFIQLRWEQLVVAVVFFILGFLLFGSLMGGFGSIGTNLKESQQTSMIWTLTAVTPMFFVAIVVSEPNGTLARVLSFIPFTAPITMMLRVSSAPVPWWEIFLSAAVLGGSMVLFLRLAAKVFRVGVLMYGKRPGLMEIVRWLRTA
jgi:ABC-2 type transport system permease protein